jgi:Histidine kinase
MAATSILAYTSESGTKVQRSTSRLVAKYRHDAIVLVAFVLAEWLIYMARLLDAGRGHTLETIVALGLEAFRYWFVTTALLVLAARWIEQQHLSGCRHTVAAALAIVAIAAANCASEFFGPWADPVVDYGVVSSRAAHAMFTFWNVMVLGPMVFVYFAWHRTQVEATSRLVAVQNEQRAAARRIAEARLQTLQARVDPRLLFQLLDIVQQTYESDPLRAERLLDELIVFLRAALSRLRGASSTVGLECELAESYVRLMNIAGSTHASLVNAVTVPSATSFPPGVLLAILESLLHADEAARIEISDESPDGAYELRIGALQPPAESALTQARAVIRGLCGDDSSVEVRQRAGAFITTVRMQHA